MRIHNLSILFLGCVLFFLSLLGCEGKGEFALDENVLFQLHFGRLEGQFAYNMVEKDLYEFRNRILMQNGFIHLVNGESFKVMVFDSFGDLIRLLYHPDKNPYPLLLLPYKKDTQLATRTAIRYNLGNVTGIAVRNDGMQFIVNQLAPEEALFDEENKGFLGYVVLRSSPRGEIIDSLGQEGIEGTPFPYIESIWVTRSEDLVIVCKTVQAWLVYMFDKESKLKYQVFISLDQLPIFQKEGLLPVLEKIIPSNTMPVLYVKMYYLQEILDKDTKERSGIRYESSRIYTLDLKHSQYTSFIDVSFDAKKNGEYELIGISQKDDFFLVRTGKSLQGAIDLIIVNNKGKVMRKNSLITGKIFERILNVNSDDSIIALLIREEYADIVWWRTDKLLHR